MTETATILRREMERAGVISLARFMELALYCPNSGYYERNAPRSAFPIGRDGDFYTSVSTGSLFGQLLAFQFAQWLEQPTKSTVHTQKANDLGPWTLDSGLCIVEAGAHDGRLAFDILDWLKEHRPKLLAALEYWLIEPSPQRQSWQRARLEPFAGQVRWAQSLQALSTLRGGSQPRAEGGRWCSTLASGPGAPGGIARPAAPCSCGGQAATEDGPAGGVNGVIFSNELLDAFPVHRLAWDRASRKWIEWGVGLSNDQFAWSPLPGVERDWNAELTQAGFDLTPELKAVLTDGFIIEHCPAAGTWWREAAAALRQGRLLTIDYGFSAQQFLAPERSEGTLRAYRRHQMFSDVLANPGEQDLTSHVNFTQLQKAGEDEGLKTDGFFTQAQFLTAIAGRMWSEGGGALSPSQARQFQTLTHPEHLGRSFRVLIQSRNC